jgi:hypothetical protein
VGTCALHAPPRRALRAPPRRAPLTPISSPSFASARRSFCYANLPVKSATLILMSKKPASSASGRTIFETEEGNYIKQYIELFIVKYFTVNKTPPEVVLLETRTPEKEGRMDGGKIGRYIARTVNYFIL